VSKRVWIDAIAAMLRRRAQLTARCETMSGLAMWTMLGWYSARSRRALRVSAIGSRYYGRRGIGTEGMWTISTFGSIAGLATVGE
jgi:hypothetical protein